MIFTSLRFYVKLVFGDSRRAKSAILTHLQALKFDFREFLHFLKAKMADLERLGSPKLISRKI